MSLRDISNMRFGGKKLECSYVAEDVTKRVEKALEGIEAHMRGESVDFNNIRAELRIAIGEKSAGDV